MSKAMKKILVGLVLGAKHGQAGDCVSLEIQAKLDQMTRNVLDIETLETRNSDGLDFHEVSVWQLRDIVARAYAMGLRDGGVK